MPEAAELPVLTPQQGEELFTETPTGGGEALDALLQKQVAEATPEPAKDKVEVKPDVTSTDPPKDKPDPTAGGTPPVTPPVKTTDEFDAIALPPNAKPKATEAFDNVKRLAREKLQALEKEKEELAKQNKELTEKTGRLPKETEEELKQLREFRRKLDVEADPEFLKFDNEAKTQEETIYSKLLEAGVAEKTIKQIKALGVLGIEWDPVLAVLPSTVKRFVEVKLTQIEDLNGRKKSAIETAKKNSEEFLTQRANAGKTAKEEFVKIGKAALDEMLPKLEWIKERKAAKDEEKPAVEAHNKFVADVKGAMQEALEDDSPEMRAMLAVGLAQMMKLRADSSAMVAAHKSELDKVKAELATANALLEKVKKGSTNRLRDTSAPVNGGSVNPKAGTIAEHPADALDRLRDEVTAGKE